MWQMDHKRAKGARKHVARFVDRHRGTLMVLGALSTWVAVGTVFGLAHSHWSFIKSLYFAVTTMSTGGLQVRPHMCPPPS